MSRPPWKGSISFGLINIPVDLYPAAERNSCDLTQEERSTERQTQTGLYISASAGSAEKRIIPSQELGERWSADERQCHGKA